MAVFIVKRATRDGQLRHIVRWQDGRYAKQVHLGSFKSGSEAERRKAWALAEIASGRDPSVQTLRSTRTRGPSLMEMAGAYLDSRIDASEGTVKAYAYRLRHAMATFGEREPASLERDELQEWVSNMLAAPTSIAARVQALSQVLDYAGIEPNPCGKLRLPRRTSDLLMLPTVGDIEAIHGVLPVRHRPLLRLIEDTGLRVGSACALRWRDHDPARNRIWVEDKTAAGRRWVQLGEIPAHMPVHRKYVVSLGALPSQPGLGPASGQRIFGTTADALRHTLARACAAAGTPAFSPHDFRHLHASRLLADGWPLAEVAARLGHANAGVTLGIYAHQVPPD